MLIDAVRQKIFAFHSGDFVDQANVTANAKGILIAMLQLSKNYSGVRPHFNFWGFADRQILASASLGRTAVSFATLGAIIGLSTPEVEYTASAGPAFSVAVILVKMAFQDAPSECKKITDMLDDLAKLPPAVGKLLNFLFSRDVADLQGDKYSKGRSGKCFELMRNPQRYLFNHGLAWHLELKL